MVTKDRALEIVNRFKTFYEIFQNLKTEYPPENILLADFTLSTEEFFSLQSICSAYARRYMIVNSDVIRTSSPWRRSDLTAIICILFVKYGTVNDTRYWDSLRLWLFGDMDTKKNLKRQAVYNDIKEFFSEHKLPLDKSVNDKSMMVFTFNNHVIVPRSQALKIFNFFKYEVLHYPYEMDDSDINEFLTELIHAIIIFNSNHKPARDDLNQHTSDSKFDDLRTSPFYLLPKGFIHACSINDDIVFRIIKPIFIRVHDEVLALDANAETEKEIVELDWYLEEELRIFKTQLIEEKETITTRLKGRAGKRAYRSPNFALDMNNLNIQLYVPEQRISSNEASDQVFFTITTSDEEKKHKLESLLYSQNEGMLTIEKSIQLKNAFDVKLCHLLSSEGERLRAWQFPDQKFFLFDSTNGNLLTLSNIKGKDIYFCIKVTSTLESDVFTPVETSQGSPYAIYYGKTTEDVIIILDDEIITTDNIIIKNCTISERKRYKNVELVSPDNGTLAVYGDLPVVKLRSHEDISNIHDLIIINKERIPYTVRRKLYIPDGDGDYLYEINIDHPDLEGLQNQIIELTVCKRHSFSFVYLKDLTYSFSQPYYDDSKEVRVTELSFADCSKIFTRHYSFPARDSNRKFRIQIGGSEYRLCLKFPKVISKFDNDESIPENIHIQQIFQRSITVECSFEHCSLMYVYGEGKQPLRITGKRIDAATKIFDLYELRNNQRSEFSIYVEFGDGELLHKKKIVTVHSSFKLLTELTWLYYRRNSNIHVKNYEGQYLSFSAVLDMTAHYKGVLTKEEDETNLYEFRLDSDWQKQEIKLSEIPLSGTYSLEIMKEKKRLGMQSVQSSPVLSLQDIPLIGGQMLTFANLINKTLSCHLAKKREQMHHSKKHHDPYIQIHNFYLEIFDIDESQERLLANGYFIAGSKNIYQTRNNPYRLSNVAFNKEDICFTIEDENGQVPSLTPYGEINKETGPRPYRVSRLTARVMEGGNA